MADKRMINKCVTIADKFRHLPLSIQALYFHLNLEADNEGFVTNAVSVAGTLGLKQDDVEKLVPAYLYKFAESEVYVIRHWYLHNTLQKGRYTATQCIDEKARLTIVNGVYFMDDPDLPEPKAKPAKKPAVKRIGYGTYQNVMLTDEEYDTFRMEHPQDFAARINTMSEYCQSHGKNYKDYLAALRQWARKDGNVKSTAAKAQPATRSNAEIFADFLGEGENEIF